jgi:glucose-1-phosphate thymidylyltransferase
VMRHMKHQEIIGLIPAAGHASRLGGLPCSKEMVPIGFAQGLDGLRAKSSGIILLENMRRAGIVSAFMVILDGKWDIPRCLGDGSLVDMRVAYVMRGLPYGPPYSLDQTYPFVRDAIVAFGFPDILVRPLDSYMRLRELAERSAADVVLGLYPAHNPQIMDMVELDERRRVLRFHIKPNRTSLQYAWINAIWSPAFTEFLHGYIVANPAPPQEVTVGHVLQAAIEKGLTVVGVPFPDGAYLDIGTPLQLAEVLRQPEPWGLR